MSKIIKLLWAACLPGSFILAGAGILWLYTFRVTEGGFYERLVALESTWINSHILLLAGTILMIPAALGIWRVVGRSKGAWLADIGLVIVMIFSFFLAGQYAIDFVMPLIAKAGGEALSVHNALFDTPITNILFYNLPETVFLGFIALTAALVWSGNIPRNLSIVLVVLWIAVFAGNILDQVLVARIASLLIGFAFIPVAQKLQKLLSEKA